MNKKLVIMGSAFCTQKDYGNLISMGIGRYDILAAGIDALALTRDYVKYFATYHPNDISLAKFERNQIKKNTDFKVICHQQYPDDRSTLVDIIIPIDLKKEPSGSSAMLGILAGIIEGYQKIILCGCPLTGKNTKEQPYEGFRTGFLFHEKKIQGIVKSMSGWTQNLLGSPDIEWLKGRENETVFCSGSKLE